MNPHKMSVYNGIYLGVDFLLNMHEIKEYRHGISDWEYELVNSYIGGDGKYNLNQMVAAVVRYRARKADRLDDLNKIPSLPIQMALF